MDPHFELGREAATTLDDGLASAITCFAIHEALELGEVVHLDRYWEQVNAASPAAAGSPLAQRSSRSSIG